MKEKKSASRWVESFSRFTFAKEKEKRDTIFADTGKRMIDIRNARQSALFCIEDVSDNFRDKRNSRIKTECEVIWPSIGEERVRTLQFSSQQ